MHYIELLAKSYSLTSKNYAVAYNFMQLLNKLPLIDHSGILEDFGFDDGYPASCWCIFFQCRPRDAIRMRYVLDYIPSSIDAESRIEDEEGNEI